MNKELNYPIKYAPFEIRKGCNHDAWGSPIEEKFCYISMPCYVVSEKKIYRFDGKSRMEYEVVFTKNLNLYNEIINKVPENNCYGECINTTLTDEISSSNEVMQAICLEKNHNLLASTLCYTPIRDAQKVSEEFFKEIDSYHNLFSDKEIGGKQKKLV